MPWIACCKMTTSRYNFAAASAKDAPRHGPIARWIAGLSVGLLLAAAPPASAQRTLGPVRPRTAAQPAPAPTTPGPQPLLRGKLLSNTWERWQRFDPAQKKKYIDTMRRFAQKSPQEKQTVAKINALRKTDPEALKRMQTLLPKVRDFIRRLSQSQLRRLRNMTPQARARWIARWLARERLLKEHL